MTQARMIPFHTTLQDTRSGPSRGVFTVVGSDAEWRALDARAELPEVDFARELLLVVASGQRPDSGYAVEIREVVDAAPTVGAPVAFVLWEERRDPSGADVLSYPIHAVRVPRGAHHFVFARR